MKAEIMLDVYKNVISEIKVTEVGWKVKDGSELTYGDDSKGKGRVFCQRHRTQLG